MNTRSNSFTEREVEHRRKITQQMNSILSTLQSKLTQSWLSPYNDPDSPSELIHNLRRNLGSIGTPSTDLFPSQRHQVHRELDWGLCVLLDIERRREDEWCRHQGEIVKCVKEELGKFARRIFGQEWPQPEVPEKYFDDEYLYSDEADEGKEGDECDEDECDEDECDEDEEDVEEKSDDKENEDQKSEDVDSSMWTFI